MKYLYYIFRLFKCPHKWQGIKVLKIYSAIDYECKMLPVAATTVCKCSKCGMYESFRIP